MTDEAEGNVKRIKDAQTLMYDGRFEDAVLCLHPVLKSDPTDVEALYMTAVCERYLKHPDRALDLIEKLKNITPDFGRAFQEEGHIYRDAGNRDKALLAYQRACQYNPALIASWKAQADILNAAGNLPAASVAQAQAGRMAAMPKELVAVTHLLSEGKTLKAEVICRDFLTKNTKHIEAMRLLADIGSHLGVMEDADFLLESALEFEPDNVQVRLDYIQILRKRQKFHEALEQSKILYQTDVENPLFQSQYAIEAMQTGDFETALALFEDVLEKLPSDASTLTSRGHALKTFGRHDDAVESYRQACRVQPGFGDAYYGLANLKTYQFDDAELEEMDRYEKNGELSYQNRVHLCFALGKAHEDRENYEQAFQYYERGNALKKTQSRYDAVQMSEELEAQSAICTADLFAKQAGKGCSAPDSIFILGLPRAGSTLVEQILASHSQVDGTLELPNILTLSHRLRRRKRVSKDSHYPRNLHDLTAEQMLEMGQEYIDSTRIHRQGAPYFIDKMPNNFRHIGLIHMILPNAKIIDARREPMACCFSGFKQLFAEGQEFTYGLEEVGRYYSDYVTLMDHWDRVLPGKILRVQHEDVLDDLDGQVRRMLDYLDLPFEESCVEFHKTKRAVRTASSEQVRQPITKASVDQWRNFEAWLGPLKTALGPLSS